MKVRFVFKSKSSPGKKSVHSRSLPVFIGRSDSKEINLHVPNDSVSRRHCEFLLDGEGRVCVRDLESTNGTNLNGKPLEPRVATPVDSGGRIMIGEVSFRIEYEAAGEAAASHDSDTIPISGEAPEPPPVSEPVREEPPTLEPEEPAVSGREAPVVGGREEPAAAGPPAEPAPPPAADSQTPAAENEPAPAEGEPAAGDFGFLAAASPADADESAWPDLEEKPRPAGGDDASLDDFLKGLP